MTGAWTERPRKENSSSVPHGRLLWATPSVSSSRSTPQAVVEPVWSYQVATVRRMTLTVAVAMVEAGAPTVSARRLKRPEAAGRHVVRNEPSRAARARAIVTQEPSDWAI